MRVRGRVDEHHFLDCQWVQQSSELGSTILSPMIFVFGCCLATGEMKYLWLACLYYYFCTRQIMFRAADRQISPCYCNSCIFSQCCYCWSSKFFSCLSTRSKFFLPQYKSTTWKWLSDHVIIVITLIFLLLLFTQSFRPLTVVWTTTNMLCFYLPILPVRCIRLLLPVLRYLVKTLR